MANAWYAWRTLLSPTNNTLVMLLLLLLLLLIRNSSAHASAGEMTSRLSLHVHDAGEQ